MRILHTVGAEICLQSSFHKMYSISNCRQSLEIAGSLKRNTYFLSRKYYYLFSLISDMFFNLSVFVFSNLNDSMILGFYLGSIVPKSLQMSVSTVTHHCGI